MVIPNMQPARRHRAEQVLVAAGGKGLNVARATHTLNLPYRVAAPLGGCTGTCLARLAEAEGLHTLWSWHTAGETRTCILVVDPHASDATPLDEAGPTLTTDDWQAFMELLTPIIPTATIAALCGSLPPGVPTAALLATLQTLKAAGCPVLVDTSRAALQAVLEAPPAALPYAVKVNHAELSAALNIPIDSPDQATAALALLRARGIALAVVTLGAGGALATASEGTFLATHPLSTSSVLWAAATRSPPALSPACNAEKPSPKRCALAWPVGPQMPARLAAGLSSPLMLPRLPNQPGYK